ncbi:molybdate ABC transporter substrate-binding protein [Utexia brackfieldae]|uniref:molybdate ABC transporter substrate-binding protein n=1 Tax=Utexia brackfieldae TaxID=3074108 RepID=UPI00370D1DA7
MKKIIPLIMMLCCFTVNAAEKITVFAAASLTDVMENISQLYRQSHPDTDIVFSFASSSALARQIEQGAPADIFMSADQQWMDYLLDRNLAKNKETLLKNTLVLIAPKTSPINNVIIDQHTDWSTLLPAGSHLAVGDPDHVPAGVYAKASLTHLGAYSRLESQLARANNVRAALMLVEMDEAPLGIVYSTDAQVSNKVKIVGEFPADSFDAIEYPISLLNDSAPSQAFYTFLKSPQAKAVFEKYGFVTL